MSNQAKKRITGSEIKKIIDVEIAHELGDLRSQLNQIQAVVGKQQSSSQMGQQNGIMNQIQQFSNQAQAQLQETSNQLQYSIQQTIQTLTQCLQYVQTTQTLTQINQVIDEAHQQMNQSNQGYLQ